MSDIRSTPTTTPITSTSNIPPSLDISSSPSRTQVHETKDSQGTSTTPRRRSLSLKDITQSRKIHRRPAEGDLLDQPPTKKMRRHHSEERPGEYEVHSSPSVSSHSGNGDHETEGERSQLSEASSAPATFEFAVPKKKRTRTLTTPHQAAVLHSLLAQSRFPTTAVREEVGKQIGLSARKVQIWFQNQRQKARRPPPQNAQNIPNRYPAYGSHAQSTQPAPDDYYGVSHDPALRQLGESRLSEHPWTSGRRRGLDGQFLPPEDPPQTNSPGFRLAGPGIPGSSRQQSRQASVERHSPSAYHSHALSYPSTTARPSYSPQMRSYSQSPPRMRESDTRSPYIPAASGGEARDHSFSRTLPPLDFNSRRSYGSMSPTGPPTYYTTRSAPSAIPGFDIPKRASSSCRLDSPFTHHPDLQSPPDGPRPSTSQSSGHWDNSSYCSQSSWSRPSTAFSARGESPVVRRHQDSATTVPPPRPGQISRRFDPVYDSVSVNEARGYSPPAPSTEKSDAYHHNEEEKNDPANP